jgi:hypothetical protein
MKSALVIACACLLVACTEKPQTASKRDDAKPWEGAQNPYVSSGWTAGDELSWDQQLKKRAQNQNEYTRTSSR